MLLQFIQDNIIAVTITVFLILFIITNNNFEKRTNQLFLAAAFCILILIFEEAWEANLALSPTYEPLRVPLSALGYTLRPIIPFFAMLIAKKFERKQLYILIIPLIINGLVAFSSLFCKISFSYTANNEFVRGVLGITPFIVAGFYVILAIYLMFITYKDMGLMEMLILSAIVLLAFITTIMESLFHLRFIQCPGMATSITFYYMFLHSNQNNRDPLTEALTRRRFYLDSKKYYSSLSAVVSLDINDLKKLNDQYTHVEGDKALSTVGRIVKNNIGTRASLYRTGGDEFIILCYKMNEEKVQQMIKKIQNDLNKTNYKCAIGYVMKSNQTNVESICRDADDIMYENKRNMKSEMVICQ